MFGLEALGRVRGFSPSEMALPNHPDVAYEFVRTLKDCGYRWVLVQEHTVEQPDGGGVRHLHLPNRLVCTNSRGESASIIALVKTQGSDTKLVAQMQPYYEARGLGRSELAGRSVPPLVTQIADGENGGVMMNEFPPKYLEVVRESLVVRHPDAQRHRVPRAAVRHRRQRERPARHPAAVPAPHLGQDEPRRRARAARGRDRGAPTRGRSVSHGGRKLDQRHLLGPRLRLTADPDGARERDVPSARARAQCPTDRPRATATRCFTCWPPRRSDFRYWGRGEWTDYGVELARRTTEIVTHDL